MEKKQRKRPGPKPRINMNTKAAKLFVARELENLPAAQAAIKAGISPKNSTNVMKTRTYKDLELKYADVIQQQISKSDVIEELIKNVRQDKDKGAKNTALKMLMERVEPEQQKRDEDEKMIVVLRA